MKHCARCNVTKPKTDFSRGKSTCRPCTSLVTREYQRTSRGLVRKIYNNQLMTTNKMGRAAPSYSREELEEWMYAQGYAQLYAAWVASDYDKWLSPSIDRLDNTKSYALDNIRLITWRQNLDAQKAQNVSGEYLHTGSKEVMQYTLEGVYVTTHASLRTATRALGVARGTSNISAVCDRKPKFRTAFGYVWRWVGDSF